ncbi:quinone oxidoreductase [Rhizobium sp. CNPSo 3464]|uniref:quinone oxidoreductase family protein n=1 Tax=Rhizobium sp. CNPSo 3464 TaxID=3021406 RepID=UPI00254E2F30|nr:quinone oxidoreductase [Rhizobium sp. CNPSo 3464]MDK4741598.1 quinone oxidoreductase [Rhizobium sp. CNPSo 3464]
MERAVRIHKYGPAEVLSLEPLEVPLPGPGEALIRHTAIGLNFVEVYFRRGTFKVPALPATLGNEGAGIVEAIGPGVTGVQIGDRVVYADGPLGAYATVRLYPADQLVHIPDAISDRQAAASFLRGTTARMLLKEVAPLKAGDTVLFHAAAGGVGLLFTQWARSLGIRVIGTVSHERKAEAARRAGCIEVINYATEDFVERVRDITSGEGVAAVFDAVGRDTALKSLATLKPRGVLALFGEASGSPPDINPSLLAPKSLYVTWPIRPVYMATPAQRQTSATDLFDAIGGGILDVGPNQIFALDDIVAAHRELESRKIVGAAVITP